MLRCSFNVGTSSSSHSDGGEGGGDAKSLSLKWVGGGGVVGGCWWLLKAYCMLGKNSQQHLAEDCQILLVTLQKPASC